MFLRLLTMSGSAKHEKENGLFPVHWKAHYLLEMFLACLPRITLDGSGKIAIVAENPDNIANINPNRKSYHRHEHCGVSVYHLNDEQIDMLYRIEPVAMHESPVQAYMRKKQNEIQGKIDLTPEQGEQYMAILIEETLIAIAQQAGGDSHNTAIIKNTAQKIREMNYRHEMAVSKLSKRSPDRQCQAKVFRCLGRETGEAWRLEMTTRDGRMYREWITDVPGYMDRTDFFKKARWDDGVFRISDNLDVTVTTLDMNRAVPVLDGMFLEKKEVIPVSTATHTQLET